MSGMRIYLEMNSQRELYHAGLIEIRIRIDVLRITARPENLAEVRIVDIGDRIRLAGAVQQVEHLGPKLDITLFAEPKILLQTETLVCKPRPADIRQRARRSARTKSNAVHGCPGATRLQVVGTRAKAAG